MAIDKPVPWHDLLLNRMGWCVYGSHYAAGYDYAMDQYFAYQYALYLLVLELTA